MKNSFPGLDLRPLRIREQLLTISDKSSWGFSIVNAVLNHTHPFKDVIQMILDQYRVSPEEVLDVIPEQTIKLIQDVYGK